MKSFPSIQHFNQQKISGHQYVFDKLDGSLIRAEYTSKRGFYKFGRKNGLIDHTNPFLLEAPDLIKSTESNLISFLEENRFTEAVAFYEFYGPSSFAGTHINEFHQVTLVDISVNKKGLVDPKILIELPEWGIQTAKLLYSGTIDQEIIGSVQDGTMEGMTFEGVVFKQNRNNQRKMVKLKNRAWLEKLKKKCGNDNNLFEMLR